MSCKQRIHFYVLLTASIVNTSNCCINTILNEVFGNRDVTYLFNNNFDGIVYSQNPHLLHDVNYNVSQGIVTENVVIFAKNDSDFKRTFIKYRNSTLWNISKGPRKTYVVFLDKGNVSSIFEYLLNIRVVFVYVFYKNETVWRYYHLNKFCEKEYVTYDFNCNRPKFNAITSKSLIDCPLNFVHIAKIFTPILKKPFYLFKEKFRAKLNIYNASESDENAFLLGHETLSKTKLMVYDGIICSPGRFNDALKYFDLSHIVLRDISIWLLLLPKPISSIKVLFLVFDWNVSLLILCFIILVIFISIVITYVGNVIEYRDKVRLITHMIMISFGMTGLRKMPFSVSLKILFMSYIFYSFQISSFYQCNLNGLLIAPPYEQKIKSTDELVNSSIQPVTSSLGTISYLQSMTEPVYVKLNKLLILNKNSTIVKEMFYNKSNVAICVQSSLMVKKDYLLGYTVPFDLFKNEQCYLLKLGTYFLNYLDEIITITIENGFMLKWFRETKEEKQKSNYKKFIALSMENLKGAFAIVSSGWIIAIIIFIAEITFKKIKRNLSPI